MQYSGTSHSRANKRKKGTWNLRTAVQTYIHSITFPFLNLAPFLQYLQKYLGMQYLGALSPSSHMLYPSRYFCCSQCRQSSFIAASKVLLPLLRRRTDGLGFITSHLVPVTSLTTHYAPPCLSLYYLVLLSLIQQAMVHPMTACHVGIARGLNKPDHSTSHVKEAPLASRGCSSL